MARIQFSKEVYEKLKKSSQSEEAKILLSKFDPNRPFKGQNKLSFTTKQKTPSKNVVVHNKKTRKRAKKKNPIYTGPGIRIGNRITTEPPIFAELNFTEEQKKQWTEASKRGKRAIVRNIMEAKKLKRVQEISRRSRSTSATFFSSGSVGRKTPSNPRTSAKNKPIYNSSGNDAYNFASEYEARNVEYGHGRRKSDEWNDATAHDLEKELNRLRQIQKEDPNTFDRQAMK